MIRFRLERPIQVPRSSLGLPGRPAIDVGVQLPDCAQRRIDVDLLVATHPSAGAYPGWAATQACS